MSKESIRKKIDSAKEQIEKVFAEEEVSPALKAAKGIGSISLLETREKAFLRTLLSLFSKSTRKVAAEVPMGSLVQDLGSI